MKKLDNFSNCLQVLKRADFVMATQDEIYRTGVIGQFNLTFELAWKAVGEALRLHGVEGAADWRGAGAQVAGCESGKA